MSLYTISTSADLNTVLLPAGLRMEESTDVSLLSAMGNISRKEAERRLANDHLAFVAFIRNQPAAFGWMARGKARIGELNHELILPMGNRYLWNFRTSEAYRGLGIYPALLQYIMKFEKARASRFWIIHAPENGASLKGIARAGFEYVGKLYNDLHGKATIGSTEMTINYRRQLEYMGFLISEYPPASCWNCSNTYLKNRKDTCCCSDAGEECIGNSRLAMAH